jgi:predicted HicB family RNase H-like nuclease
MTTKNSPEKKPRKKKKLRTNTPRERGVYKSYSIRILKRDLDRLQKQARKQQISFNTFVLNALIPPVPVDEIDDPSKYREVASGEALQN